MLRILICSTFAFSSLAFAQPTYYNEVSRIFRDKCENCHRDNDIAPFALKDYDTAQSWAMDIRSAISENRMPPWKPVAGHGEFKGSYALTVEEKQTIIVWVDAGAPDGDDTNRLQPMEDKGEWALGYPDKVLSMLQSYTPPRGTDVYRCFVIPTDFTETKYLRAVDVLPGNRGIVHHVLLYADTKGIGDKLDAEDPEPGYSCFGGPGIELSINTLTAQLGGWAPGQRPRFMPDDVGFEVPAGAKVIMQVHYFPVGKTGEDQTRVGFYFADKKPKNKMLMIPVLNQTFKVAA